MFVRVVMIVLVGISRRLSARCTGIAILSTAGREISLWKQSDQDLSMVVFKNISSFCLVICVYVCVCVASLILQSLCLPVWCQSVQLAEIWVHIRWMPSGLFSCSCYPVLTCYFQICVGKQVHAVTWRTAWLLCLKCYWQSRLLTTYY